MEKEEKPQVDQRYKQAKPDDVKRAFLARIKKDKEMKKEKTVKEALAALEEGHWDKKSGTYDPEGEVTVHDLKNYGLGQRHKARLTRGEAIYAKHPDGREGYVSKKGPGWHVWHPSSVKESRIYNQNAINAVLVGNAKERGLIKNQKVGRGGTGHVGKFLDRKFKKRKIKEALEALKEGSLGKKRAERVINTGTPDLASSIAKKKQVAKHDMRQGFRAGKRYLKDLKANKEGGRWFDRRYTSTHKGYRAGVLSSVKEESLVECVEIVKGVLTENRLGGYISNDGKTLQDAKGKHLGHVQIVSRRKLRPGDRGSWISSEIQHIRVHTPEGRIFHGRTYGAGMSANLRVIKKHRKADEAVSRVDRLLSLLDEGSNSRSKAFRAWFAGHGSDRMLKVSRKRDFRIAQTSDPLKKYALRHPEEGPLDKERLIKGRRSK